ncbi:MAG: 1-acyl-sn-glycerol-3-phosphate acyltransferase, partial [Flavobacteriaceae bacterium]
AIVEKLQFAIEQHPSMMKVIPEKELKAYESENKKREWS